MGQVISGGELPRVPLTAGFLALNLELQGWGGTYRVPLLSMEGRPFSLPHHLSWMTVTATTTAKVGQALDLVQQTAALSPAHWIAALWITAPATPGAL